MGRVADWVQMFRAGNCLTGFVGVFLGSILSLDGFPQGEEAIITFLLALSVYSFMASWNALNDYVDIEIDKLNRPDRPLPDGRISTTTAMIAISLMMLLSFSSLVGAALYASSMPEEFSEWYPTIVIWFLAIFLLVNYESIGPYTLGLKEKGLPGNLAISLSVGLVVLFGAAGVFDPWNLKAITLFLIGTLFNFAREIIKDVEDMEGDEGRNTYVMRVGAEKARLTAWVLLLLTLIVIITPFVLEIFPVYHLILVSPSLFVLLTVKKNIVLAEDTVASKRIKISMILAIFGLLTSVLI